MKRAYILVCIVVLAGFFLLPSCTKDDNGGFDPNVDGRDRYEGTWSCIEQSSLSGTQSYTIIIKKSTSDNVHVLITSFYNLTSTTTIGTVNGNYMDIEQQNVSGNIIEGSGVLDGNKLTFQYTVNNGIDIDTVTGNCTRL